MKENRGRVKTWAEGAGAEAEAEQARLVKDEPWRPVWGLEQCGPSRRGEKVEEVATRRWAL